MGAIKIIAVALGFPLILFFLTLHSAYKTIAENRECKMARREGRKPRLQREQYPGIASIGMLNIAGFP